MNKLSFKYFCQLKEMAVARFGKHADTHINDINKGYAKWMFDQIEQGKGNFRFQADDGTWLSPEQIKQAIQIRLNNGRVAPTSARQPIRRARDEEQAEPVQRQQELEPVEREPARPQANRPMAAGAGERWLLGKTIAARPALKIPSENLYLALKQEDANTWTFVTLDFDKKKLGEKGTISTRELRAIVRSERDDNGALIEGNPTDFLERFGKEEEEAVLGSDQAFEPEKYRIKPEWVTEHQKAVRDVFSNSKSNIVMPALAGSGKTTMLKDLASNKKPGEKWLYLVFNKKNQKESEKAFPPGVEVFTSHSFVEKKIFSLNPGRIPPTDVFDQDKHGDNDSRDKSGKLINDLLFGVQSDRRDPLVERLRASLKTATTDLLSKATNFDKGFVKNEAHDLLSKAKNFAVNPQAEELNEQLVKIMKQYGMTGSTKQGVNYTDAIIDVASQVLRATLPAERRGELGRVRDHDDTLWWTALHAEELRWPQYDVVLADEVQDFNVCQQIMLKKLSEAGARIVAVGDENQAIYAFRGADAGAFSALEKTLGQTSRGVEVRSLPKNFRSSPVIIDYVNKNTVVNNLESGKSHDGMVKEDQTENGARAMINDEWSKNKELDQETAFLAPTNKALGLTALDLLVKNIPVTIVGRNLSEEITKFLTFALWFGTNEDLRYEKNSFAKVRALGIKNFLNQDVGIIPDAVDSYYRWRSSNPRGDRKQLEEDGRTADNINALVDQLSNSPDWVDSKGNKKKVKTVGDLLAFMKDKLRGLDIGTEGSGGKDADIALYDERKKNPRGHVVLSTIHKSKGLEFERVFILENDKLPTNETSKSRRNSKMTQDEAQAENLKYVAYTRAKNQLHLINNSDK